MGRVISLDNQKGESAPILTRTGEGGLLSSGYLRDDPAAAYLGDETPVFVLTNQKRGVEIDRDGDRERVTPGSGYRTITVVTDRRLLVLIGDSSRDDVDGDQRLSLPYTEIESVTVEGGRRGGTLTVARGDGTAWTIHAGGSGLSNVAEFVRTAGESWTEVEATVDGVTRALVTALDRRDDGEYDDALDAAQAAADQLADAFETARAFDDEWSGSAMLDRVQQVDRRCKNTIAKVRVGRARRLADDAERRWREGDLEGAHDAYDRASKEFEAVRAVPSAAVDGSDRIDAEAERVERTVDRLEEAPLQRAVDADRAAQGAEDPAERAEQFEAAIELYRDALAVDADAETRRFAGEPSEIRGRIDDLVEKVTAERRTAATDAKQAGEWYMGTEKYDLAVEEFETARDQFDRAVAFAEEHDPEVVDHLDADRAAVTESLERARTARDGEAVEPAETEPDDEPDYEVEATIGTPEGDEGTTPEDEASDDDPTATGEDDGIEAELAEIEEGRFADVVGTVLGETGWRVEATDGDTLVVAEDDSEGERMLVRLFHRPDGDAVGKAAVDTCSKLRRDRSSVDAVMLATSAGITDDATRRARDKDVRLLDDECLAAVIEAQDRHEVLSKTAVELD